MRRFELAVFHGGGLSALAFGPADVHIVHDPQQPWADAMPLQIEAVARPQGADVSFLDQILGPVGVARQPARDAVEQVELLEGQLFKLFPRRFQKN